MYNTHLTLAVTALAAAVIAACLAAARLSLSSLRSRSALRWYCEACYQHTVARATYNSKVDACGRLVSLAQK
jgi:hypothetical protein